MPAFKSCMLWKVGPGAGYEATHYTKRNVRTYMYTHVLASSPGPLRGGERAYMCLCMLRYPKNLRIIVYFSAHKSTYVRVF